MLYGLRRGSRGIKNRRADAPAQPRPTRRQPSPWNEMDRLLRGILPEHNLRFAVCQGADLCTEAVTRHQADWVSGWLLSESLICAVLLSTGLNDQEKYTLRWIYPGPAGTVLADTNADAQVRGFPQRLRMGGEVATLTEALGGSGLLSIITSLPDQVLQTGYAQSEHKDLVLDMAHMVSQSHQVRTGLNVGLIMPPREPVALQSALGVLVQPLPDADDEMTGRLLEALQAPSYRQWLEDAPREPEEALAHWLPKGVPWDVLGEIKPRFACNCSQEKVQNMLRLFGRADLEDMYTEQDRTEIVCHFCATKYGFSRDEVEALLIPETVGHA